MTAITAARRSARTTHFERAVLRASALLADFVEIRLDRLAGGADAPETVISGIEFAPIEEA